MDDRIPGAMPQAKAHVAPLALNTSVAICATRFGNSSQKHSRFASRANLVSCASVQNLAIRQKSTDALPSAGRHFSPGLTLSILFLAVLWFFLCRQLSGEWSVNEQYNYGWFVPFFAVYLFWLRWEDRPEPRPPRKPFLMAILIGVPTLFLLLPVRLFEIANPDWRLLSWLHAASVVTLTLLYIWSIGGPAAAGWLRHFAFPVSFIFVAVPWVTPIEAPIIQGLMRAVARVATETVTLFGIPAQVEGNLIRVTNGLVGVNEACSGVRSLQTSLMIGLLFGELKRLSVSRRAVLIAGSVAIALLANFLRAVLLVWVAATTTISEVSRWHDIAGYTILALVFIGTLGLAYLLGKSEVCSQKEEGRSQMSQSPIPNPQSAIGSSYLIFALTWLLTVEVGVAAWYRSHENNLLESTRWSVHWPEAVPNFRTLKIDNEIRRVLRFDEGQAAVWTLATGASPVNLDRSRPDAVACFVYLFRWKPGRNSALLANLHRPDVCLPAIGWTQVADEGVRTYPVTGSFALPFRHFEFRHASEDFAPQFAHAFYCLTEDRTSSAKTNPLQIAGGHSAWTRDERIRLALEGRRHLGQQVIEVVFVSSNPIPAAEAEASLANLVHDVVSVNPASE
jgi:exosortase